MGQVCLLLETQLRQVTWSGTDEEGSWDIDSTFMSWLDRIHPWCHKASLLDPASYISDQAYEAQRLMGSNWYSEVYGLPEGFVSQMTQCSASLVVSSPTAVDCMSAGGQKGPNVTITIDFAIATVGPWPRVCTVRDTQGNVYPGAYYFGDSNQLFSLAWNTTTIADGGTPPAAILPSPSSVEMFMTYEYVQNYAPPYYCNGLWVANGSLEVQFSAVISYTDAVGMQQTLVELPVPGLIPFGTCESAGSMPTFLSSASPEIYISWNVSIVGSPGVAVPPVDAALINGSAPCAFAPYNAIQLVAVR